LESRSEFIPADVSPYGFDEPSSSFGLWRARQRTYLDLEVFLVSRRRNA
jgi:hypothetical protein